jgi:undecaprenyl-diphosphatase
MALLFLHPMEQLLEWDKALFLYLNSQHTPWLDPIMMLFSHRLTWVPLYLLLLALIVRRHGRESWIPIVGIGLTILLADQVCSSILKPVFARLRPSHEPSLDGLVYIVDEYRGGHYGFASSHAANTFGLAMFFVLRYHRSWKWTWFLFPWAAIVAYTRIYLGVHYPGDVIVGALIGMLAAYAGHWTCRKLRKAVHGRRPISTKDA